MRKYNVGDIVFFISNGYHIREATVIRAGGGSVRLSSTTMKLQQEPEFENLSYSSLSRKLKL